MQAINQKKNYGSFDQCVRNKSFMKALFKSLGQVLNKEVAALCSKSEMNSSDVYKCSNEALMNVKFSAVMKKLEQKAPTLLSLLKSCIKTSKPRTNSDQILALLIGVICKHRRSQF